MFRFSVHLCLGVRHSVAGHLAAVGWLLGHPSGELHIVARAVPASHRRRYGFGQGWELEDLVVDLAHELVGVAKIVGQVLALAARVQVILQRLKIGERSLPLLQAGLAVDQFADRLGPSLLRLVTVRFLLQLAQLLVCLQSAVIVSLHAVRVSDIVQCSENQLVVSLQQKSLDLQGFMECGECLVVFALLQVNVSLVAHGGCHGEESRLGGVRHDHERR
mmetsp:Transcript_19952/g.55490  ORF Transcript_19952/g.55490 Transcript_19952/m.55490 type:complete len:219 (-) Transcript_19952:224-880(-)